MCAGTRSVRCWSGNYHTWVSALEGCNCHFFHCCHCAEWPNCCCMESRGKQLKTWVARITRGTMAAGERSVHVLFCYAPTLVSWEAKENFFDDRQQALDEVPSDDSLVLLGDFNTRIGSGVKEDDPWEHVRGPDELGQMNKAGREFLNSLLLNKATICNSWFQPSATPGFCLSHNLISLS